MAFLKRFVCCRAIKVKYPETEERERTSQRNTSENCSKSTGITQVQQRGSEAGSSQRSQSVISDRSDTNEMDRTAPSNSSDDRLPFSPSKHKHSKSHSSVSSFGKRLVGMLADGVVEDFIESDLGERNPPSTSTNTIVTKMTSTTQSNQIKSGQSSIHRANISCNTNSTVNIQNESGNATQNSQDNIINSNASIKPNTSNFLISQEQPSLKNNSSVRREAATTDERLNVTAAVMMSTSSKDLGTKNLTRGEDAESDIIDSAWTTRDFSFDEKRAYFEERSKTSYEAENETSLSLHEKNSEYKSDIRIQQPGDRMFQHIEEVKSVDLSSTSEAEIKNSGDSENWKSNQNWMMDENLEKKGDTTDNRMNQGTGIRSVSSSRPSSQQTEISTQRAYSALSSSSIPGNVLADHVRERHHHDVSVLKDPRQGSTLMKDNHPIGDDDDDDNDNDGGTLPLHSKCVVRKVFHAASIADCETESSDGSFIYLEVSSGNEPPKTTLEGYDNQDTMASGVDKIGGSSSHKKLAHSSKGTLSTLTQDSNISFERPVDTSDIRTSLKDSEFETPDKVSSTLTTTTTTTTTTTLKATKSKKAFSKTATFSSSSSSPSNIKSAKSHEQDKEARTHGLTLQQQRHQQPNDVRKQTSFQGVSSTRNKI